MIPPSYFSLSCGLLERPVLSAFPACDQVMEKVGSPKGLIRYDTLNGMENGWTRAQLWKRVFRPRILIYTVILWSVIGVLIGHIATRMPVKLDVMRDRGALSREVKNGVIENVYRVNLINSAEQDRTFRISVNGLPSLAIDTDENIDMAAASTRTVALRVRAEPDAGKAGSNPIQIVVEAVDDPTIHESAKTSFFLPEPLE